MISSRRRDAYSVARRYLVNDEQIRKKKKKRIKVSLLKRTMSVHLFQYSFLVIYSGNHCQLSGFFLVLVQRQQGFANTECYKGLPDPNVMALKARQSGLTGSRVPCHP